MVLTDTEAFALVSVILHRYPLWDKAGLSLFPPFPHRDRKAETGFPDVFLTL